MLRGGPVLVLLVGPEAGSLAAARAALERAGDPGLEPRSAADAEEALRESGGRRPALALLDAADEGALRLLARLRERTPDLPVVVVGEARGTAAEAFLRAGADDHLGPEALDGVRLARAVRSAVHHADALRELATRNAELLTLHRLSTVALGRGDLRAQLGRMARTIADCTSFPLVAIETWDAERGALELAATAGCGAAAAAQGPGGSGADGSGADGSGADGSGADGSGAGGSGAGGSGAGVSLAVAESGEPRLELGAPEGRAGGTLVFPGGGAPRVVLAVPIRCGEQMLGVLSLGHPRRPVGRGSVLPWAVNLGGYLGELIRQRRVEEALATSEQRFRQLAENIEQTFWLTGEDRESLVYVSPNCRAIWGRTPEELLASPDPFAEHVHPDDVELVRRALAAQRRGEAVELEHRVARPDELAAGRVRWVRTRAFPVPDAAGGVSRMSGITEDVTERKRAEEALMIAARGVSGTGRAFFRSVVESLSRALGLDHVLLLVRPPGESGPFEVLAGHSLGRPVEDETARILCEATDAVMRGEVVFHERGVRAAFPDNEQFARFRAEGFFGVPLLDGGGTALGALCGVHGEPLRDRGGIERLFRIFAARAAAEVERLRAERALEDRLALEALLTGVSGRFVNLGHDELDRGIEEALAEIGRFAGVERSHVYLFDRARGAARSAHGWSAEGADLGREPQREVRLDERPWFFARLREDGVVHVPDADDLPAEAASLREALRERGIRSTLCVAMVSRGEAIGFLGLDSLQRCRTWSDDSIALLRLVGETFASALERRRGDEERQRLEAQLRQSQKMEAIGTLAGGVAHDFNNLLTGILGYADLIQREASPESRVQRAAEVIEAAAERAADLTRQLLGFARRGKARNVPVRFEEIVPAVVSLLERTIEKSIAIETDLAAEPAAVLGDPSQMEQVLLNLALNARDAMPDGGRLRFATRLFEAGGAAGRGDGRWLEISVADTGCGIGPAVLDRIFEPFFTTKEPGKGTGMGLAMVYGIVDNHGGTIRAESAPGLGTRFVIRLPVASLPAAETVVADEEKPLAGSGLVLVVDDEPIVLNVAEQILRHLGYDVLSAAGGEQALELYSEHGEGIEVVVLDLVMPRMGGREVLRRLKELNPDVRVVLSSGWGVDGAAQQLIEEGSLGFARKPYDVAELAAAVAEAIAGGREELSSGLVLRPRPAAPRAARGPRPDEARPPPGTPAPP